MINTILSFVFIVPDGYRLKQDGIYIEFVNKSRDKWGLKDKISGYYINKNSKIVDTVYSQRAEKHGNIFHTESQASFANFISLIFVSKNSLASSSVLKAKKRYKVSVS
jgi:hypothetical protein